MIPVLFSSGQMTYIPANKTQTATAKVLHESRDGRNFAGQHREPANRLTVSEKEKILTIWNRKCRTRSRI